MTNLDQLLDQLMTKDSNTIITIPTAALHPFPDHPFKVQDNEEMAELTESIKELGVLTPLVVRPLEDGQYEVISGHRRLFACRKAEIDTVPAIVHNMDRDQAAITLVDSNLHREHILPSEKAYAYKMKADALSHQGKRTDLTSGQLLPKSDSNRTTAVIGGQTGESYKTVQRYIRLTNLIPELLDKVDAGQIALSPGVELSYLDANTQHIVFDAMEEADCTPSFSQTVRMKNLHREGKLGKDTIYSIMAEEKANQKETVRISKDRLRQFLPYGMDARRTEEYIVKACEYYRRYLQRQRDKER